MLERNRDAEQSNRQHLAIYAAANDNIWIGRAELKGKNVIWALEQQLQSTQKKAAHTHTRGKKTLYFKADMSKVQYLFILVAIKSSAFNPQNQMHTVDSILPGTQEGQDGVQSHFF